MKPTNDKTMEAIYLQSMTDFILKIDAIVTQPEDQDIDDWNLNCFSVIENYAKFLKQPLKLEMFVPCDDSGNVLEEPTNYEKRLSNMMTEYNDEVYTYNQAKERVLFKGFEHYLFMQADNVQHNKSRKCFSFPNYNGVIIEDLISLEVELTPTAIKQIGL